jgi:hypothetical protein
MRKTFICELPYDLFVSGEDIFVGLGWDSKCELDAGILIADKPGSTSSDTKLINIVNYSHKTVGSGVNTRPLALR